MASVRINRSSSMSGRSSRRAGRIFLLTVFTLLLCACNRAAPVQPEGSIPSVTPSPAGSINQFASATPGLPQSPLLSTPFEAVKALTRVNVPILLFHHISQDAKPDRYYVDPQLFDQQMAWLSAHGYQTISEAQLARVIVSGGDLPDRPVIITFDDGDADLYTGAYPIMQKYAFTGVAFLITGGIDAPGEITSDQVKTLIQAGWEIGSHTVHHKNLVKFPRSYAVEICDSKTFLESKFGIVVDSFAYPYGLMDNAAARYVADCGYTSAAGLGQSIVQSPQDLYYLSRIEIHGTFSLDQFISLMPWK